MKDDCHERSPENGLEKTVNNPGKEQSYGQKQEDK
jgi:hypothetical protein